MTQDLSRLDGRIATKGNLLTPVYVWVVAQRGWRAVALTSCLGALANLAFPPLGLWPAMALALSGLVWSLDGALFERRALSAVFTRVFAFGFTFFLIGLHWVASAFLVDPDAHLALVWLPLIVLPAGLALILAGVMTIGFRFWSDGPGRLVTFTIFFVLAEWVRGALFGLGGLPWNLPGMVWLAGGAISQSASIWGIYGLSLLSVLALVSPAALADARAQGTTALRAAPVLAAAVAFGGVWGWGSGRLATGADGQTGPLVRLVEVGVPQAWKYQPGVAEQVVRRFRELTGPDEEGAARIVVWPEGALPYYLFEWPDALDAVTADLGDRRLIVGLARRELTKGDPSRDRAYNSLAVLNSDSSMRGPLALYDKHMLVPFGEFTPLRELAGAVGISTLQNLAASGFYPGPEPATLRAPGVPAFGPLICYEAIFPGLSPTGVDRPDWLVNVSNDSWFGGGSGPFQHAAQARYRAIEEGLPMSRVAAGGLTGMIDAYGRWTAKGERADPARFGDDPEGWRSSVAEARIPSAAPPTLYSRWRDALFWGMWSGLVLIRFFVLRARR
jgi:apolipoprotein N-acyltransferase